MSKKKILIVVGIICAILIIGYSLKRVHRENPVIISEVEEQQTVTTEDKIYRLMMLEFNRDLTEVDISEMNEDERDFYFLYLYDYSK